MARRRLPYKEGDWFAVPLRCGGYALGVVARMDGRGGVLSYFFSPRYPDIPSVDDLGVRAPEDAILVANMGDLGFLNGTWKVIGRKEPWERDQWPMPVFGRYEELSGRAWRVHYSEENLVRVLREEPTTVDVARSLPRDAISGYAAVENRLSRLLC